MRRIVLIVGLICLAVFQSYAYAQGPNDSGEQAGRYVLYELQIKDKATPVLLDSQTGKVWIYQQNLTSSDGDREKFKGVTVEGLSYSLNESKLFEKEIKRMREIGALGNENKVVNAAMEGAFSYSFDINKAIKLEKETPHSKDE